MCWELCVGVHCEWDKQGPCPGGAKWTLGGYLLSEVVLMANGASDPNWGVTVGDSPFQYSRLTGGTWISLIKTPPVRSCVGWEHFLRPQLEGVRVLWV